MQILGFHAGVVSLVIHSLSFLLPRRVGWVSDRHWVQCIPQVQRTAWLLLLIVKFKIPQVHTLLGFLSSGWLGAVRTHIEVYSLFSAAAMPQTRIPRDASYGVGHFTLFQAWSPIRFGVDMGPLAGFIYNLLVICFRNPTESV